MRVFVPIYFALSISLAIEGFCAAAEEVEETSLILSIAPSHSSIFSTGGETSERLADNAFPNRFTQNMNEKSKAWMLGILAKVAPEGLARLEAAYNRLTDRANLAVAFVDVAPEHMERFEAIALDLTQGMEGKYKVSAVMALSKILPERLTDHFKGIVNGLSQDMNKK